MDDFDVLHYDSHQGAAAASAAGCHHILNVIHTLCASARDASLINIFFPIPFVVISQIFH